MNEGIESEEEVEVESGAVRCGAVLKYGVLNTVLFSRPYAVLPYYYRVYSLHHNNRVSPLHTKLEPGCTIARSDRDQLTGDINS